MASKESVIIITGKGTDPYIMGKNGEKTPWDDKTVAEEELNNLKK
jgi:UDP-N-acetylmuramyl tripeptide synthase